jgi:anti-sigma factor RsiW
VKAGCREISARLPQLAQDALPEAERRELRGHLAVCAECRREAVETDALLAFSRFSPEEVSPEESARILEGVRHAVSLRRAEARLKSRPSKSSLGKAAAAAAALAAVLLIPGGPTAVAPEAPASARASSTAPAGGAIVPAGAVPDSTDSGATVYDWNPGGGEPRVVWIVDRSLDI